MSLRYIEDLIFFICDPVNNFDKNMLNHRDMNILYSINSQLSKSLAMTEKQAALITKIINENINLYTSIENIKEILDNQQYKMQFRKIEYTKKIYILSQLHDQYVIAVDFKPYDIKINNLFKKHFRYDYYRDGKNRYLISCNESNIISVVNVFKNYGFEIENCIIELHGKIKNIQNNIDSYVPIATVVDDTISLNNCNNSLIKFFQENSSGNFIQDCILLKSLGVKFDNTIIEKIKNFDTLDSVKNFFNSKKTTDIKTNTDIVNETNSYPTLIIMRSDDELNLLKKFIDIFNLYGIENKNVSVLYRSKDDNNFNSYIKEKELNNFVDENTKLVFIKYKIPKILYKLNFKPKMILNTLEINAHFSLEKLVEHHPFVLTCDI